VKLLFNTHKEGNRQLFSMPSTWTRKEIQLTDYGKLSM